MKLTPTQAQSLAKTLAEENGETVPAPLPLAVRAKLERAEEDIRTAVQMMRERDHTENATDLLRTLKHLQAWTQRDGWLDFIGVPR